jgi:hypothetical protein
MKVVYLRAELAGGRQLAWRWICLTGYQRHQESQAVYLDNVPGIQREEEETGPSKPAKPADWRRGQRVWSPAVRLAQLLWRREAKP